MLIETPRRLHLGLIDPSASLGRRFGSLSVALEHGYRVKLSSHSGFHVVANEEDKRTINFVVDKMNLKFATGFDYLIEVERAIPRHVGLGSTTQLTLAVGLGIARLNDLRVEIEEIASLLGRGKNSGAGTYVFKYGGFIVDGGIKDGSFPPLILRKEFPKDWVFLLIIPSVKRGFDEKKEKPIMESVRGKENAAEKISHRILLGLLPALEEKDIAKFGKHLSEIQALVGRHFEEYQGGKFRKDLELIMEFLRKNTYGYGQSSWGPTVYGLVCKEEYKSIKVKAYDFLRELGIKAEVDLGIPKNKGAMILG